jgi:hypothetical protein
MSDFLVTGGERFCSGQRYGTPETRAIEMIEIKVHFSLEMPVSLLERASFNLSRSLGDEL